MCSSVIMCNSRISPYYVCLMSAVNNMFSPIIVPLTCFIKLSLKSVYCIVFVIKLFLKPFIMCGSSNITYLHLYLYLHFVIALWPQTVHKPIKPLFVLFLQPIKYNFSVQLYLNDL